MSPPEMAGPGAGVREEGGGTHPAQRILLFAWDDLTSVWAAALARALIAHGRQPVLAVEGVDLQQGPLRALASDHPEIEVRTLHSLSGKHGRLMSALLRQPRRSPQDPNPPGVTLKALLCDMRALLSLGGSAAGMRILGRKTGRPKIRHALRNSFALHRLLRVRGNAAALTADRLPRDLVTFLTPLLRASLWGIYGEAVRKLVRSTRPDAALLARDVFGSQEHVVRVALENEGVPVCLMPVAYTPKAQLVRTYGQVPEYRLSDAEAALIEKFIPGAVAADDAGNVARLPRRSLPTMALLDRGGCDAWRLGGKATLLAGNGHLFTLMRNDGFSGDELVLTGHPKYDEFSEFATMPPEERTRRRADLGCDPAKALVTVCIAPDIFQGKLYKPQPDTPDFASYIAMLAKSLEQLKDRASILVSPHPRLRGDAAMMAELGKLGTVTLEPIQRLIGISDGFVTYVGSSVNVDASILHVPSLAVVLYEGALDQMQTVGSAQGLRPVWSTAEAVEAARELLEPGTFDRWTERMDENAKPSADLDRLILDGKAGERILRALDQAVLRQRTRLQAE